MEVVTRRKQYNKELFERTELQYEGEKSLKLEMNQFTILSYFIELLLCY